MDIIKKELVELLKEDKLLVVDFHAEWCNPCKAMSPIIEELRTEYNDRVNIVKVNIDEQSEIANDYSIRSIPTILFFKDGEIVEKKVGSGVKSELSTIIDSHI